MEPFGGAPLPARMVVPRSRGRGLGMVALTLVMFAASVACFFIPRTGAIIGGVLGVAFFGFALIFHVRALFSAEPVLEVDDLGFTDRTSAVRFGPIAWSEVADLRPVAVRREQMVAVQLRNPDAVIAQGGRGAEAAARMSAGITGAPVNIVAAPTGMSAEQLASLMLAYARRSAGAA